MATITVMFDTQTKEMAVLKDGQRQDGPYEMVFYRDYDDESKYTMRAYHRQNMEDGMSIEYTVTAQKDYIKDTKKKKKVVAIYDDESQHLTLVENGRTIYNPQSVAFRQA